MAQLRLIDTAEKVNSSFQLAWIDYVSFAASQRYQQPPSSSRPSPDHINMSSGGDWHGWVQIFFSRSGPACSRVGSRRRESEMWEMIVSPPTAPLLGQYPRAGLGLISKTNKSPTFAPTLESPHLNVFQAFPKGFPTYLCSFIIVFYLFVILTACVSTFSLCLLFFRLFH